MLSSTRAVANAAPNHAFEGTACQRPLDAAVRRLLGADPRFDGPAGQTGSGHEAGNEHDIVVQPNVITPDQKAWVQVGERVRITKTGGSACIGRRAGRLKSRVTVDTQVLVVGGGPVGLTLAIDLACAACAAR